MSSISLIALVVLSLFGLVLSSYIYYKRTRKQELVCVIGDDCNKVIKSKYGKTFIIPNDVVGIFYYILILISSLIFLIFPEFLTNLVVLGRFIVVGIAALFSVYLSLVQIFILKELCEYCLGANFINLLIFIFLFV